jgi:tetratricopeptide (TPR) repeat protein
MRHSLLLLLLAPAVALSTATDAAAQSMADADLCNRIEDNRHPEARPQVQQLAQAGGARGSFFAGCLALADDKFSDAAGHFERAVKSADDSPVAHFFLGRAYGAQAQRANLFKQASLAKKTKREFDRAAELDPNYLDAREGLAQYYSQAPGIAGGSKDKARAQMEEIRKRSPWRGGLLAAQLANREKNVDGALREWTQLTTLYPDSLVPWVNVAFAYAQQKRWDDAWATLDRLQKTVPGNMWVHYGVGRLAAESGQQLDRGEAALKRYLGYTPKPGEAPIANAHWRLGTIYEKRGQTDAARREYQTAVSLDPKLTGAKDALAKLK